MLICKDEPDRYQSVRRGFDSTVSPNQMVAEIQAYLVDVAVGRNHQGGDQIVPPIGTELVQGNLRAGENNRFLQTFQHEGQGRGAVGHGVGAVENDEAVVALVVLFNGVGHPVPLHVGDVGRIQKRIVFDEIPLRHGIGIQIPNLLQFAGKISLLRLVAVPGRYHADGAAGVNNADSFVHTFLQMFYIINKSNENSSANYTP